LLETPAGAGTELLTKIEDFINFVKKINHPNFGICMDTCHVFASGYDPYNYLCKLIENDLIPILIHFNDSKMELASRKDRHEFIGKGKIPF
jgi:deoxyribonuclease-4